MKKTGLLFTLAAGLVIGMIGCSSPQQTASTIPHKARPISISAYEGAPPSAEGIQVKWSPTDPEPHTVFGDPAYKKNDPKHNITREYFAFTVYYDDVIFSPRWTAIKITREIADKNKDIKRRNRFKADPELKEKGYQTATHDDYENYLEKTAWQLWPDPVNQKNRRFETFLKHQRAILPCFSLIRPYSRYSHYGPIL